MALLGLQRRTVRAGELRYGFSTKNDRGYKVPQSSDTWILTTPNREAADAFAEFHGGTVEAWTERRGVWVVRSEVSELVVTVPQANEVIQQAWELWEGGNCLRRCDNITESKSGQPCLCPADIGARERLAKQKKPAACGPKSRLSVVLPHIPGAGVFVVASSGREIAREWGDVADFMQQVRDSALEAGHGLVLLQATLRIVTRGSGKNTHRAAVLQLRDSLAALASGEAFRRPLMEQLPPRPDPRIAITAGPAGPAGPAGSTGAVSPARPAAARPAAPPPDDVPPPPEPPPADDGIEDAVVVPDDSPETAALNAAKAMKDATTRGQIRAAMATAMADGADRDNKVSIDGSTWPLGEYANHRWAQLPAPAPAAGPAGGAL